MSHSVDLMCSLGSEPMRSSPLSRRQGLLIPGRVSQRVEMQPQFPATRGPQSSKLCDPLRLDGGRDKIGFIWFLERHVKNDMVSL